MGNVKRFEELIAWQAGRTLAAKIYAATTGAAWKQDRRLVSQIRAAAVSVNSNIAEGYERGSPADFHKFLVMAKASCAEVRSQLYTARDVGHLPEADFQTLLALTECVSRLVGGLREAVRKRITANGAMSKVQCATSPKIGRNP